MNCKRDQLAWIVVPRCYAGTGLEQMNNCVVKTIEQVHGYPEPLWRVTPRQVVVFTSPAVDASGRHIHAGDSMWTDELPDSFLRPFDPNSEPKAEPIVRELETLE